MKSNLISKQKCAAQPLAYRKERKTWENTLKCSTISLFLPWLNASKKKQQTNKQKNIEIEKKNRFANVLAKTLQKFEIM
mgnify:CR=1 FL=1